MVFYAYGREVFVRQLANILEEDSTNLSRELSSLESVGILSSMRQGNLKYFKANRKCPFFYEIKGLVLKTVGVIGELKFSLEKKPDIKYAFICGSYAKGAEMDVLKDKKIMLIGDESGLKRA